MRRRAAAVRERSGTFYVAIARPAIPPQPGNGAASDWKRLEIIAGEELQRLRKMAAGARRVQEYRPESLPGTARHPDKLNENISSVASVMQACNPQSNSKFTSCIRANSKLSGDSGEKGGGGGGER